MSLTGAQAVAQALSEARCTVITHVPGRGATLVHEATLVNRVRAALSFHEEAAYAIAHGAALCGSRAAVLIKSHGLLKAANAMQSSLAAGVTAGLVVVVAGDAEGRSSDTIFDVTGVVEGLGLPFVRAVADDAHDAVLEAFARSERTSLPQAVLVESTDLEAPVTREPVPRKLDIPPLYARDPARHLVCPLFTRYQREVLDARRTGGEVDAIARPRLPHVPDDLPESWHDTLRDYAVAFEALRTVPRDFTAGDTGLSSLFGLPPYHAVDAVTYYGGSIPLAVGAWLAGREHAWAVTGDYAFAAAGALGLTEAAHRQAPVKVVIFANGQARATGGQTVALDDVEAIIGGYEARVHRVEDARDGVAVREAVEEATQRDGLRIVLLQYPVRFGL